MKISPKYAYAGSNRLLFGIHEGHFYNQTIVFSVFFYYIFRAFKHIFSFILLQLKVVGTSFSVDLEAATGDYTSPALAQSKKVCMRNSSPLPEHA